MVISGDDGAGWWYFFWSPPWLDPLFWLIVIAGLITLGLVYGFVRSYVRPAILWLRYKRTVRIMREQMTLVAKHDAEQNWLSVRQVLVDRLGEPETPDELDGLETARQDYVWYYRKAATRGIDLKWHALGLPRLLRQADRDELLSELARYNSRNRDLEESVLDDLRGLGVPDYYLRVPYRYTTSNAPVLFA